MAKLTDITIKPELRLCKVNLGASYDELGFFHCWEHFSQPIGASPFAGGAPAGVISKVYGVVEFADGVRSVLPEKIKFCDEDNAYLVEMNKYNKEVNTNG